MEEFLKINLLINISINKTIKYSYYMHHQILLKLQRKQIENNFQPNEFNQVLCLNLAK